MKIKHIFFTLIAALTAAPSSAQSKKMLEGNPEWSYVTFENSDNQDSREVVKYTHVYLDGQETIENKTFYKVFIDEKEVVNGNASDTKTHEFTDVLIREEGQIVYAYFNNLLDYAYRYPIGDDSIILYMPYDHTANPQEYIIYDFTKEPKYMHDIFISVRPWGAICVVSWQIHSTEYKQFHDGISRLCQNIGPQIFEDIVLSKGKDGDTPAEDWSWTWIEGIGSVNSMVYNPYLSTDESNSEVCKLNLFKQNGTFVYVDENYTTDPFLGDEYATNIKSVSSDTKNNSIFDLQGRALPSTSHHGIVIENGRKVIQK